MTPVIGFDLPAALEAKEPPERRGLRRDSVRLLVARRAAGTIEHRHFTDLPELLEAGDVLVVNTSATLPAALSGRTLTGEPAEVHLSTRDPHGRWIVELRHPVPPASAPWLDAPVHTVVELKGGGWLELLAPADRRGRRLWVAALVLPEPVLEYLARWGRPIRYAYLTEDQPIGAYQTVFADEPGSAEMPSAARPFSAEVVTRLVTKGVVFAPFVLHTGVSSPEAHEPPSAEWFRVGAEAAGRVDAARRAGHRIVAVGTTAVRALESAAGPDGRVRPARGWTELVITPERGVRVVDGLITGWHEPQASHLALLEAVAGRPLLQASYREALEEGYLWHEFGDSHLILP